LNNCVQAERKLNPKGRSWSSPLAKRSSILLKKKRMKGRDFVLKKRAKVVSRGIFSQLL
jgi:hypothetical protein